MAHEHSSKDNQLSLRRLDQRSHIILYLYLYLYIIFTLKLPFEAKIKEVRQLNWFMNHVSNFLT